MSDEQKDLVRSRFYNESPIVLLGKNIAGKASELSGRKFGKGSLFDRVKSFVGLSEFSFDLYQTEGARKKIRGLVNKYKRVYKLVLVSVDGDRDAIQVEDGDGVFPVELSDYPVEVDVVFHDGSTLKITPKSDVGANGVFAAVMSGGRWVMLPLLEKDVIFSMEVS